MSQPPLLIYLHGLNSSPQSKKAQKTLEYIESHQLSVDTWVPQLPNSPMDCQKLLAEKLAVETEPRDLYLFGSSLGGYYGTWLMQWINDNKPFLPTHLVLINPAVRPYELFQDYLGPQFNEYTEESWNLTMDYVEELITMEIQQIEQPENIMLMLQKGDDVLDYRKALEKHNHCYQLVEEGGSHEFENYESHLPLIFRFLTGEFIP